MQGDDVLDDEVRVMMLRMMRWRMMMLSMMMSRGRNRMMLRMMMLRRRRKRRKKIMILRMLMWRRRTDLKTAPHVLCEPAQSKCTWTWHKSHFILCRNLEEKCRAPKPRRRLCASLRSRNALQHVTGAALYGNFQEKCRAPD